MIAIETNLTHIRATSKRTKLSLIFNIKPKSHHSTWFLFRSSFLACFWSTEPKLWYIVYRVQYTV